MKEVQSFMFHLLKILQKRENDTNFDRMPRRL